MKTSKKQHDPAHTLALLLWGGAALLLGMIVLGGVTRLTGSGLSIVEWQPIRGMWPPINTVDWQILFEQYKGSPEYQTINSGMDLAGFKGIFWLEFIHRFWGRLIGLYYASLAIYAAFTPSLRARALLPLLGLIVLGGGQGAWGWYMVKSGLVLDPHVSPYRLTGHLALALATLFGTLWLSLSLHWRGPRLAPAPFIRASFVGVCATIAYGGLVAGHKAGLVYNTFPLMGGHWVPLEFLFQRPWYLDLVSNPVSVQFIHRCLAMTTLVLCFATGNPLVRLLSFIQVSLGIATLVMSVPVSLGALHQAVAVLLFSALVRELYGRPAPAHQAEIVPLATPERPPQPLTGT